jgi:predicted permease
MPLLTKMRAFLRNIFSSRRADVDLDQEVHSHFEMLTEERVRSGMSPEEAQRAARIELGGLEQVKEQVREERIGSWLHSVLSDCRFTFRQLRKNLGITVTVLLTLALGIGVNTAMFSLLNGWLLRPLPLPAPQQITVLASEQKEGSNGNFSYLDLRDFQKQIDTFSDLFAYTFAIGGLSADGDAREIAYSCVTGNYFSALGVKPALGRLFFPGEGEKTGGPLLVVLGYSFWQEKFGGDPGVVGRSVLVNGKEAVVIGVAAEQFHGTLFSQNMDAYLPLNALLLADASANFWTARDDRRLTVMGRLKHGTTLKQAQSSVDLVAERLASEYPATDNGVKVRVVPERLARPGAFVASFVPVIASLFLVLAGLVLLLACTNVANILLVRAAARSREIAIRSALGASRARIVRQIVTETLWMALLGSAAGVLLGVAALDASGALLHSVFTNTSNHGFSLDVSFDWRVFVYASITAVLAGILVGLWPAFRATRSDVNTELREGRRSNSRFIGRHGLRNALAAAQLACSLILLIAAGLFVQSLNSAEHMYLGFNPDRVLNVILDPHEIGYGQARTIEFYRELEERVRRIPGVQATSLAFTVPMGRPGKTTPVFVQGHPVPPQERPSLVPFDEIGPSYLETMQVPLRKGRAFADSDNEMAPLVAIVNQAMAKRFWPREGPIGKRFSLNGNAGPFVEIVGMVGDGQYFFLSTEPQSYFYLPLAQNFVSHRSLQVRASIPWQSLMNSVQDQIHRLAPDLPIEDMRTMQQMVHGLGGLFLFRMAASVSAIMGSLGLLLAIIGVYGVVSYSVSQRTREIGIRMALGAKSNDILRLLAREGLALVGAGVGTGLLSAWALTRTISNLLIDVSATDPATFASAAVLLALVALVASYIPSRRATQVDPMVALRYE